MNILPLNVKNLNYVVNGKNILKNINIECNNNNVTIVAGNNGSGKSTFLKILHGLIKTQNNNKIKWG
jgi:ABC-type cobalamin/Fe3+-siderophores transport system ATPase subunit